MSEESKKKRTEEDIQKVEVSMPSAKSDNPIISVSATEEDGVSASMDMLEMGNEGGEMIFWQVVRSH